MDGYRKAWSDNRRLPRQSTKNLIEWVDLEKGQLVVKLKITERFQNIEGEQEITNVRNFFGHKALDKLKNYVEYVNKWITYTATVSVTTEKCTIEVNHYRGSKYLQGDTKIIAQLSNREEILQYNKY